MPSAATGLTDEGITIEIRCFTHPNEILNAMMFPHQSHGSKLPAIGVQPCAECNKHAIAEFISKVQR